MDKKKKNKHTIEDEFLDCDEIFDRQEFRLKGIIRILKKHYPNGRVGALTEEDSVAAISIIEYLQNTKTFLYYEQRLVEECERKKLFSIGERSAKCREVYNEHVEKYNSLKYESLQTLEALNLYTFRGEKNL